MNNNNVSKRLFILTGAFFLICFLYVVCLIGIVLTEEKPQTNEYTYQYITVKASRGEIYDRNGEPLVTNHYVQNLMIDDQTLPADDYERNKALLTLLYVFNNSSEVSKRTQDKYPFTGSYPNLTYTEEVYEDTTTRYRLIRRIAENEIEKGVKTHTVDTLESYYAQNPDAFPSEKTIIDFFLKKYGLDEKHSGDYLYTDVQIDALLRLYYDMECNNFGGLNTYIFATDLSLPLIISIEERGIAGVTFSYTIQRCYEYPGYASHILGMIGQIYAEDWEYYKALGYNMNDYVGISGCEYAFEQYLRGIDGVKVLKFDKNGNLVDEYYKTEPVPGNDVYLTIDINLQIAAEDGLAENIKFINKTECQSGALVANDPNTGEILAIASYPTFDLTTYNADYLDLYANPAQPLYNRALQGLYAPGSTFKMGMVVAGMQENVITSSTPLLCEGTYKGLGSGYQPGCTGTHGYIDAANALRVSCNCYFYELGKQLGIESMNQYCSFYGFGQKTGVELYEEVGILAGESYREQHGLSTWQPGDTIAAAIGQSDNSFTPIQIASYVATVVNGGTRYSAHLLHSVKEHFTDNTVVSVQPTVLSELAIDENTLNTVKYGMELMIAQSESNNIQKYMRKFPVTVGGKTGTAEIGIDNIYNCLFVCAAPISDPDIVVSVVIEKGPGGSYACIAASRVLEAYYTEP